MWYPNPGPGGCRLTRTIRQQSPRQKANLHPTLPGALPHASAPPTEGPPRTGGSRAPQPRPLPKPDSPSGTCSFPGTCWKTLWVSGAGPPRNVESIPPSGLEVQAPDPGCPTASTVPTVLRGPALPAWTAGHPSSLPVLMSRAQGCGGRKGHSPDSMRCDLGNEVLPVALAPPSARTALQPPLCPLTGPGAGLQCTRHLVSCGS